mmetsp:Transcript_5402/g.10148  ORF Transcript_5402/g.10148 Transcript_5402/m.10148 type:complete len:115 (+) Transcript_5402:112-456(+)
MKFSSLTIASFLLLLGGNGNNFPLVGAFAPVHLTRPVGHGHWTTVTSTNTECFAMQQGETSPCAVPEENEQTVNAVTAQALRSASLLDFEGKRVTLGNAMKEGTSIVVFLRHLG